MSKYETFLFCFISSCLVTHESKKGLDGEKLKKNLFVILSNYFLERGKFQMIPIILILSSREKLNLII